MIVLLKAVFHLRRSRSLSRSRRQSASDLVKIENRSRKRSQNGYIFFRFRLWLRRLWPQWKLDCRSRKRKPKNKHGIVIGWFFRFCLWLRQSSFHWIISVGVISGIGRKWNCSDSSDSDYDSVASENQPLKDLCLWLVFRRSNWLQKLVTFCIIKANGHQTRWHFLNLTF